MGCEFFDKKCVENGRTDFEKDFCINQNGNFTQDLGVLEGNA